MRRLIIVFLFLSINQFSLAKDNEYNVSDLFFIDQIGLKEHLSPNRSNGLVAMIKKMKTYALVFSEA